MKLQLNAYIKTPLSTISRLYIDGNFECYILEDTDRDLHQYCSPRFIEEKKLEGKTAIPEGTYKVIISKSFRFKRDLPSLLAVRGFSGVRIIPGPNPLGTDGSLLPGKYFRANYVGHVKTAFDELFKKLEEEKDDIIITIKRTIN